ncbi:biosynthetic-type acetolactate synthase large subunit [Clostridium saccharobutylicum]|uniref:Acetolactate synthase n=1 Tax=Clostridium saccharobutylicum DSM 13864 TaxID=1345695 RepID=U5MTE1_CLOSA|nr:biosynthetic-type acetolactate synthase large subunit [Clostridium saccharobutylicum]AGX42722.1 acetolactate synthase isozyme 1 large subunit [Clostridium saccharobutylicum DSM 13864]AQR90016.1 acetolactate synthase isozyme 1 large subunit [Clostridium saccharobutylicum]AQR99921.1 acetolactate synthase isozyme 1 large subunit [Clostridium saccharobutylicum]AQS13905.1 acetolactate synthase isozyme 1 large subunit [Clostridium saccharobutylicum]MBA2904688.1 acetolactate synthase-1/2/3 large s
MKCSGAEIIIRLLENEGVEFISGIPGGFNLPMYDALYNSKIKHILARHEQGAAFIAQGISRTTDKVGVCFATSGPGATNLLTAIADAKLDSIPLIVITGQVPLSAIGTDAFQEVDAYGLTIPITKHNFLIRNIHDLFTIIPEAFRIATEGRPGPVLIDIPKNIQTEIIELEFFPNDDTLSNSLESNISNVIEEKTISSRTFLKSSTIECIAELINNSRKPIIYAGGGIISSNASSNLYELAKKNNIPVALSLMGLGAFPCDDDLSLGMLGMHAAPYTNYLLNEADLILAFGIRFDDRATGNIDKFCPNASIIHVDIDPSELNKVKTCSLSMAADIKEFLDAIIPYVDVKSRNSWVKRVKCFKEKYPLPSYENTMHPANLIPFIASKVGSDAIIAIDVGEHQMWTAQRYPFKKPKTLLTSGGLGTMGFGLPVSIGAALVNPDKNVLCFSGDGSILMNIQELATLADFNLNVKVIILTNHHLGLVRQQQELFYNKHYIASSFISNPNFKVVAEGFGMKGYDLGDEQYPLEKLENILNEEGPCVINVPIDECENIFPMVAPGKSNLEMIGGEKFND